MLSLLALIQRFSPAVLFVLLVVPVSLYAETWERSSERLGYTVSLEPRDGTVDLNAFEEWTLTIRREDGGAVDDARIVIGGGMPGHGHGLPSQPVVTGYLGSGQYRIEGLKFNMLGLWLVAFGIDTPDGRDRVVFELELEEWSEGERALMSSLYLAADTWPEPSPSNRYADDPRAAALGERLFFDDRMSADGSLSCASCHQPERFFTDGLERAQGVARAGRNTPTVIGAAFQTWFYWDGRRDSLWSQALVPFEAPDEMGSSRSEVVRHVYSDPGYREAYNAVFGAFPEELDETTIPADAGPLGTEDMRQRWASTNPAIRGAINEVYVNLGKAIEAYQRGLPLPRGRFDRFVEAMTAEKAGAGKILDRDERAGLELFLDADKTHCMRCHNGPWFTNGGFSNIGTGNFAGDTLDFGRVFGLRSALTDEFNCAGPYSDASPDECAHLRFMSQSAHIPLEGAFKVPGLRNVAGTAPYMHDGRFETLRQVVEYYRNPPETAGAHELVPLDMTDREARQLVAFLESLSIDAEYDEKSRVASSTTDRDQNRKTHTR